MSQHDAGVDSPLADRRVRSLIGLASGTVIAVIAVLFLEGTIMWLALGIAVLDVLTTPYILKMAVEQEANADDSTAFGE